MSWTYNPVYLLEKEVFVSVLCQFVPLFARIKRLILISKTQVVESSYRYILSFQYYFDKPHSQKFLIESFAYGEIS